MNAPTIYLFDPTTGELLDLRPARCLPKREHLRDTDPKKWQLPANATFDPPPQTKVGEVACHMDGLWTVVPDHRGVPVYDAAGHLTKVASPGPLPGGLTTKVPPGPLHVLKGGAWVEDATAKAAYQAAADQALLIEALLAEAAARYADSADPKLRAAAQRQRMRHP